MKSFELKFVLPPKKCRYCGHSVRSQHLVVLAANEEEAMLMRKYLKEEGFEG